jgi:predicted transposase/invertase (TIGR01784 family)
MSSSPHDALFKEIYGRPEHAAGALRAVVPAAVGERLDWSTLARCPGSFVDPALRERHTDLLFSARWRRGGEALVYLVFEHQSSPDPQMAFRLLRYLVRVWERWWTEHADAKAIPAIVPVVLYHGAAPWSAPRWFSALIDLPEDVRPALASHLVEFAYLVDDLSEIPDARLRARAGTALLKLAALSLKHARTRADFLELMAGWGDVMRAVVAAPHGLEALAFVMRYILLTNDHVDRESLQALVEREVGSEAKDAIVTVGERLIEQGRQEGVQQGRQEGVQQGRQEGSQQGKRELLLSLLRRRFGTEVDGEIERRLATASTLQIETWADRVFSAATLTELLAD